MHSTVREIKEEEYALLEDFLYEAIFVPEGTPAPPRSVLSLPELRLYVDGFGSRKDDAGPGRGSRRRRRRRDMGARHGRLRAHRRRNAVARRLPLQGTPRTRHRHGPAARNAQPPATQRLRASVSLSVQKANYALKMYEKAGFEVVDENEEEYVMLRRL